MVLYIELNYPERILNKGVHLGYEWVVSHNNRQHRCGYVRIPKGHPFYGIDTCDTYDITVHGGITFSVSDEDKYWWWLGFDCNHYSDAPDPTLPVSCIHSTEHHIHHINSKDSVIRTQAYVETECKSLCEQAFNASPSFFTQKDELYEF